MNAIAALGSLEAPGLRRVRKVDAVPPAFGKPDAYVVLMACWVDYMNTDDRDLGAGRMKLNGEVISDLNVYEQQRADDLRVGAAVAAMVDSLERLHRWAICRSQRIATAWNFPNADYAMVLSEARDALEEKLRRNIATRVLFE